MVVSGPLRRLSQWPREMARRPREPRPTFPRGFARSREYFLGLADRRERRADPRRVAPERRHAADPVRSYVWRLRRATPLFTAASATAAATAGTTRESNIEGVMYSSLSSDRVTMVARACAAASFISSLTRRARTSSMPRKKPGKPHELLIWLG